MLRFFFFSLSLLSAVCVSLVKSLHQAPTRATSSFPYWPIACLLPGGTTKSGRLHFTCLLGLRQSFHLRPLKIRAAQIQCLAPKSSPKVWILTGPNPEKEQCFTLAASESSSSSPHGRVLHKQLISRDYFFLER